MRGSQVIGDVIHDVARGVAARDTFSAEENILVDDVAAQIGFVQNFGGRAVPVDFAVRFLDAVTVAVVGVVHARGGSRAVRYKTSRTFFCRSQLTSTSRTRLSQR